MTKKDDLEKTDKKEVTLKYRLSTAREEFLSGLPYGFFFGAISCYLVEMHTLAYIFGILWVAGEIVARSKLSMKKVGIYLFFICIALGFMWNRF